MGLRSGSRKLSFEILSSSLLGEDGDEEESRVNGSFFLRSSSDPIPASESESPSRKRKPKRRRKKKPDTCSIITESADSDLPMVTSYENGNGHVPNGVEFDSRSYSTGVTQAVVMEAPVVESQSNNLYGFGDLRQRSVGINGAEEPAVVSTGAAQSRQEDKDMAFEVAGKQHDSERPRGGTQGNLETAESLDWKRVMSEDPNCESMDWLSTSLCLCCFIVLYYFLFLLC